jgi:hypothetical protein
VPQEVDLEPEVPVELRLVLLHVVDERAEPAVVRARVPVLLADFLI